MSLQFLFEGALVRSQGDQSPIVPPAQKVPNPQPQFVQRSAPGYTGIAADEQIACK